MRANEIEDIYTLTPMQQGILFEVLAQQDPGLYFEQGVCSLHGTLSIEAFTEAWRQVIASHPALRTGFVWEGLSKPVQVVHRHAPLPMDYEDWRHLPDAAQEKALEAFLEANRERGLKLDAPPLMRLAVFRRSNQLHHLVWGIHHLIHDAWSTSILLKEVLTAYESLVQGKGMRWERGPLYKEYVAWLKRQDSNGAEEFWRAYLDGVNPPSLTPYLSRPGPAVALERYRQESTQLSVDLTAGLMGLARRHGLTLNTLALGAWAALMSCYNDSEDVLFGTVFAGRPPSLPGVESMVGLFINTLPMRIRVSPETRLLDWLKRLQNEQQKMREFEFSPLSQVKAWGGVPRESSLFNSIMIFENAHEEISGRSAGGLVIGDIRSVGHSNYPFTLRATPGTMLSFEALFDSHQIEPSAVAGMLEGYRAILGCMAERSDSRLIDVLEAVAEGELNRIQIESDGARTDFTDVESIHELIERQSEALPDRVAVVYGDSQLSYGELDRRANRLAHYLRKQGIGPDSVVGLCTEGSLETIVGALGVLKAGGAYLPLDPNYPLERLSFMLRDSQAKALLTEEKTLDKLAEHTAHGFCFDRDWRMAERENDSAPAVDVDPENLAYIIYTSGSTGQPKGVQVTRRNLLYSTLARLQTYEKPVIGFLLASPFTFDSSVAGVFWTLVQGGTLLLPPKNYREDFPRLIDSIFNQRASHLLCLPSLHRLLLELASPDELETLQTVIVAGESCPSEIVELHHKTLPRAGLFNEYGPTETTVWSSVYDCANYEPGGSVPIGRAISTAQLYLLGKSLRLTPPGASGELCIGGLGLSRGYLGRPDLTAERFLPNPYGVSPGERLYRTGDRARFLSDGELEFLGRDDFQIKIRGYRIETGEVEAAIKQYANVRDAAVGVWGTDRLVAYVVCSNQPAGNELRDFLRAILPEYMVPAAFIFLESLPLASNGKIDRRALPPVDGEVLRSGEEFAEPQTEVEKMLAKIWAQSLGVERVGIDDNFFDLGGDSIRSIQILSRARGQGLTFSLQQLLQRPTVRELAKAATAKTPDSSIQREAFSLVSAEDRAKAPFGIPFDVEDMYPLTELQQGMFFHDAYSPDAVVYHNVMSLRLRAPFDAAAFRGSLEELARRHPVLRTSFRLSGYSEALQLVHRNVAIPLEIHDLSGRTPGEQDSAVNEAIKAEKSHPFDPALAPLIRFLLHRLNDGNIQLTCSFHHAILDGWSAATMFTELFQLYLDSPGEKTSPAGESPAVAFRDYVALEREAVASGDGRRYWEAKLDGALGPELPLRAGGEEAGGRWRYRSCEANIPRSVSDRLKEAAKSAGVPLKSVLLAAHLKVLVSLGGRSDVLTGVVQNGRPEEDGAERVLGLFLNTLPFRMQLLGGTWTELAQSIFRLECEDLQHRRYPLSAVLRNMERRRPVETAFHFVNFHVLQSTLASKRVELVDEKSFTATNFAWLASFGLELASSRVTLRLEYDVSRFGDEQIKRYADYYVRTLTTVADDPAGRYELHAVLSAEERHQQIIKWNDTERPYPGEQGVHEIFEDQARQSPEAIAIVSGDEQISYKELNRRANQVAHYLCKLGMPPEARVGVLMERSISMLVGILGVLKAGGVYVPLDPTYPTTRLQILTEDASIQIVLTQRELVRESQALNVRTVCLDAEREAFDRESDHDPIPGTAADSLAYIMYTSGSTGRPKGVEATHRGVVRLVCGVDYVRLGAGQIFLHMAPVSFDASTFEIWGPLLHGGRCVLVSSRTPTFDELGDVIRTQNITTLWLTSSLFNSALEKAPEALAPVRQLLIGGEALSVPHIRRALKLYPSCQLINGYGPTEGVTFTCCYSLPTRLEKNAGSIPIGRPIANTRVYLLDELLQPVPVGAPGEIYIGGDGLARGYGRFPELTAERFIPDPHSGLSGARLYRTGDLARYLSGGDLEFLGRTDQQLKIRGFRIDPGEVETILNEREDVRSVVVTAHEDESGERRLVAYIVPHSGEAPAISQLRGFLGERLPTYLIPTDFVFLKDLPLTSSGKLDRGSLPTPERVFQGQGEEFAAPRTISEIALAGIWAETLGLERVGIHENFFDLGGHSLLALRIMARISEVFGVKAPLRSLFEAPTVAGLASVVDQARGHRADQISGDAAQVKIAPDPADRSLPFPLTDVQQAYWVGRNAGFELGGVPSHSYLEVEGTGIDLERLDRAWRRMIERHAMLRAIVLPDGRQQVLEHAPDYQIRILDLRGQDPETVAAQLDAARQEMSHQMLRTDQWPLFDIRASIMDGDRVRIHFSFDVLIADARSSQILSDELTRLYRDPEMIFPPLELSFRDYVLAEYALRSTESYQRSLDYWADRIQHLPPAAELPLARTSGALTSPRFVRRSARLEANDWRRLKKKAGRKGLTLSAVLLTAFAHILGAWSKSSRFTINLTLFNRLPLHPQVNDVIGDFTSLTLLAVDHTEANSFEERARRLQEQLWNDLDHREVSGVHVLRELAHRTGGNAMAALAPVVFTSTLNLSDARRNGFAESPADVVYSITQTPQVWLDHQVFDDGDSLGFNWDAVEDLFPDGVLGDMFDSYVQLLEGLASEERSWSELIRGLIPTAQLLQREAVNNTDRPLSGELLQSGFVEKALQQGEHPAIITTERTITYAELYRSANRLGRRLRELGAAPNRLIAVVMEKGWEQAAGALGILFSGAAYVPIDPDLPPDRFRILLESSEATLALTQSWLEDRLEWPEGVNRLCVDRLSAGDDGPLEPAQTADDLAYVIFTSGSTGVPKGVMIDHRGAVNTILDINERFNVGPEDRVLALSSLSFDLSVYDLFGALAAGGTIVIPDAAARRDPAHWAELLRRERVTLWNSVPALIGMLVEQLKRRPSEPPLSLRAALLSGDWIPISLPDEIKELAEGIQVVSLGGATEASIWSILYPIEEVDPKWASIPYGRPMMNQSFHVLDEALEPRPIWATGRLYIGGIGLAKGYWRDEEKTRASFINHPRTGERLYRTGDLGRYLPDGNIEFLGREDFQVKVQGFRIELGEVEAALSQHARIRSAAVTVMGDPRGERKLAAYIMAMPGPALTGSEVREFLSHHLPEYMTPAYYRFLDAFPLTANGKVDRQKLPPPELDARETTENPAPLQSSTEEVLAMIWSHTLDIAQIGRKDNFFELGGNSLQAIRLIARVRDAFNLELPLRRLFEAPTLDEFAACVESARKDEAGVKTPPLLPAKREGEIPLSFAQQRLWFAAQLEPNSPAHILTAGVRLQGQLDAASLERSFNEVVRRHEALRSRLISIEGRPKQVIKPTEIKLSQTDLRATPEAEREGQARQLGAAEAYKPFNLVEDPLIRAHLLRLDESVHILIVTMHHIVSDGWSMSVLVRELGALYEAFSKGLPSPLAELPLQYADYAVWQMQAANEGVLSRHMSYWAERLKGYRGGIALAPERSTPRAASLSAASHSSTLSKEVLAGLKRLSREEGATTFMVLQAAFISLLYRHSGQTDIAIGADVANRTQAATEGVIGFFVNILALRTDLGGNPSFRELLRRVRETTLEAYMHQDLPFEKLVEELRPARALGLNPLVQVVLSYQKNALESFALSDISISHFEIDSGVSNWDLALFVSETEGVLSFLWKSRIDILEAESLRRMAGRFETLLASGVLQPETALDDLVLIHEAEREQERAEKERLKEARFKKFKSISVKPVSLGRNGLVKIADRSQTLPLLLEPAMTGVELAEWARANSDFLESRLSETGAILFRGFNVASVSSFERIAESLCSSLYDEYGDLPREEIAGKVYSSTPYPADQAILFHNESSHLHRWPQKIFFFCVKAAQSGGETPLVDCRKIYRLLDPKIKNLFEQKGLIYVRNFSEGLDVSWREFFRTDNRLAVEEFCRKSGVDFEWRKENGLRTRQARRAVATHPRTGEAVFFNQIQLHHISCLEPATRASLLSLFGEEDLPRQVYFGDGSPIEDAVVREIRELYWSAAATFRWQEGDVLMVDNVLTAHARMPYTGPRKIVAAMGDMVNGAGE